MPCDRLNVCVPRIHISNPNPRCDGVRRWSVPKGGAPLNGTCALTMESSEFPSRPPREDTVIGGRLEPSQGKLLLKCISGPIPYTSTFTMLSFTLTSGHLGERLPGKVCPAVWATPKCSVLRPRWGSGFPVLLTEKHVACCCLSVYLSVQSLPR